MVANGQGENNFFKAFVCCPQSSFILGESCKSAFVTSRELESLCIHESLSSAMTEQLQESVLICSTLTNKLP